MAVKRGGLGKGLDSMIPVLDSTATKKKPEEQQSIKKRCRMRQKKLINIKKKRWNLRGNLENRYRL